MRSRYMENPEACCKSVVCSIQRVIIHDLMTETIEELDGNELGFFKKLGNGLNFISPTYHIYILKYITSNSVWIVMDSYSQAQTSS